MTIGDAFGDGQKNNFDIIRLAAATIVIVSHSYPLTGHTEPFKQYIWYGNAGSLAVSVFFAISGFLTTRSVERHPITYYISARILRIFPGLVAALLFSALIIGPLFTTKTLTAYFNDYLFYAHLKTAFLFTFNTALPGVFEHNPYPTWVNGSLWSLPYEFLLYLLLPCAFIAGGLRASVNFLLLLLAIVGYFLAKSGVIGLSYSHQGNPVFGAIYPYLLLEYGAFFVVGSSLWIYRSRIPMSGGLVFILFVLSWAGAGTGSGYIFYCMLVPYATIWCALRFPMLDISKIGDISYGVYIYAFPIQQSIAYLFKGVISPTFMTGMTIPVVFVMAYISYHFLEKRALEFKLR